MRLWPKLLLLALGLALLAGLGIYLLRTRPFVAAPELPRLSARGAERLAPAIRPEMSALPKDPFPVQRAPTPPLTQTTNLLLAGIDTRPDGFGGGRTDALVLVVIDRRSAHVGLVGVPRDLVLELPGHGLVRVNTVYLRGSREGGATRGVQLLEQAVRQLLGLTVDHTIFLDHAGFEALIDELGGVAVRVRCPIRDRFLDPRGPGGRLELVLDAGVHWLDGRTALMFARSRHGRGVVDRARRQLALLLAIRDRLAQLGPTAVAALLPRLRHTVYTEMSTAELLGLARLLRRVKRTQIHGLALNWRHVTSVTLEDGRKVMRPQPQAIHQALSTLFQAGPPGQRQSAACPPMDAALRGASPSSSSSASAVAPAAAAPASPASP